MNFKKIYVGLFVLIALVCFFSLFYTLGKVEFKNSYYKLNVVFRNVGNISLGTPVLLNGVKIGKVRSIYLLSKNDDVVVVMQIRKKIRIRKKARVKIIMKGILGENIVEIWNPRLGENFYKNGSTFYGSSVLSISTIAANLNNAVTKLGKFIKNSNIIIKNSSTNIQDLIAELTKMIKNLNNLEGKNSKNVTAIISKTKNIVTTLDEFLGSKETKENVKSVVKIVKTVNKIKTTISNLLDNKVNFNTTAYIGKHLSTPQNNSFETTANLNIENLHNKYYIELGGNTNLKNNITTNVLIGKILNKHLKFGLGILRNNPGIEANYYINNSVMIGVESYNFNNNNTLINNDYYFSNYNLNLRYSFKNYFGMGLGYNFY